MFDPNDSQAKPFERSDAYPEATRSLLEQVDMDLDDGAVGPFSPRDQADALARLGSFVIHFATSLDRLALAGGKADTSQIRLGASEALSASYTKDARGEAVNADHGLIELVLHDAAVALSASVDTQHVLSLCPQHSQDREASPETIATL